MSELMPSAREVQLEAKQLQGLHWQFTGKIDPVLIEKAKKKRLLELCADKKLRIKGFRSGQLTPRALERLYGHSIEQETLQKLAETAIQDNLKQKQLIPIVAPELEWKNDNDFHEFTVRFESYPVTLEVKPLNTIKLERPVVSIDDLDVERALDALLERYATLEKVDVVSAEGHYVIIDFKGRIDGETFPGGEVENFKVKLGSNTMIDGFETQLIGLKPGTEKILKVTFPENYAMQELAGKDAEFETVLHSVNVSKLPEITEEFIKTNLGIEDGKVSTLRRQLTESLRKSADQIIYARLKEGILEQLFQLHRDVLPLPKTLLHKEIIRLHQVKQTDNESQLKQQLTQADLERINLDTTDDPEVLQAIRNISLFLLLREIARVNKIEVSEDRIKARLQQMLSNFSESPQYVQSFIRDENRMAQLQSEVLEEQIVDYMAEHIHHIDKKMTYQQLVHSGNSDS